MAALLAPVPIGWTPCLAMALQRCARERGWTVHVLAMGERPQLAHGAVQDAEVVIADCYTPDIIAALGGIRRPVVGFGAVDSRLPFPQVTADTATIGRLACEHLRAAGCGAIAVLGHPERAFSRHLMAAVRAQAEAAALPFSACIHPALWRSSVRGVDQESAEGDRRIAAWLRDLPGGCGIIAWGDHAAIGAHRLLPPASFADGARMLLSAVDTPLLLGVEPDISAVAVDPDLFAAVAVEMAIRLADGERPAGQIVRVPVRSVEARATTMPAHQRDPLVARALAQLSAEPANRDLVPDLARRLGVSRRTLERHFRELLGMSPARYRARLRAERMRALIAAGLPRAAAARRCGLSRAPASAAT